MRALGSPVTLGAKGHSSALLLRHHFSVLTRPSKIPLAHPDVTLPFFGRAVTQKRPNTIKKEKEASTKGGVGEVYQKWSTTSHYEWRPPTASLPRSPTSPPHYGACLSSAQ
jgi:hypothetical protein